MVKANKTPLLWGVFLFITMYLLRRFTGLVDWLFDPIQNKFTMSTETQKRIYDAAIPRLIRNFTKEQAEQLAKFMVAQAAHETGNFRSNVFRNNLNAFGYKRFVRSPYQKKENGFMSPEGNNYASYNDVADSSREIADWLGRRKADFTIVKTATEYAAALKKHKFFTDNLQNYTTAMNKHYNSFYA